MEKKQKPQIYTVDATGQVLGRMCSSIAKILMGKTTVGYERHILSGASVNVINASKLFMTEKRKLETMHEKYSGYPGGLKYKSNAEIISKKGYAELIRLAVYNMLPPNRLRQPMMNKLKITE
ncbi:50S ribosomal protein L13 [Candidatus Nomurabacteria bacterium RIFCSPHIGHO2_02_FULL_33_12]|uniref:50S ribosomal protein L13 n=1 Tax=Candidatus Nomurabacteria bacterium RIFCSPLOWO2_01_FULL_33_17 TaxID=1801764 RepID=A0A1F6WQN3_9BACT|nr:MAG: 50S ribosomal protein L13 [Candidatus Nomurabacteria bacterium RIFCSPHIGHO2_02_FULL_33_12]OGI84198.1 MAG: 50S ribosomal protein L13 [Candidatus Nomurabacteria bacterium RIFCSPLOWO2_01_FULL_33_17]